MSMLGWMSKHVFFPLWEIKDGAQRLAHLRQLNASQWFAPEKLQQRQWDLTGELVAYAFHQCPYYRRRFADIGFDGSLRHWDDFRHIPILSKQDIQANTDGLLSRAFRLQDLVEARTGGSTGMALTVYFDEHCQELRNAAGMRSDHWAGRDIGMKIAAVWGNPTVAKTWKEKLRSVLLDRALYLDTMDLSEVSVRRFVDDWRREMPSIIFGHSHSIYILANYLQQLGITDLRPRGIITTSMMLLTPERRMIEEVFNCACTNRYGCEEVGLIASECEHHNGLHLNVDHLVVEFLKDDGTEAAPGEEGNVIVTDLTNRGMPIIRYRVEDIGVPSDRLCPCGRGLPLMERVTGRRADFLKRPDGSLVAGVSLVERTLTAILGIQQMQLVQDDIRILRAKVVRDGKFNDKSEYQLRHELESVFGEGVTVEIRYVPALDQTTSGKYRFAVCTI